MIKGNVGSLTIEEKSILVGSNHFINVFGKDYDGIEIKIGDPVGFYPKEGLQPATGMQQGMEVLGIALNDSPKGTKESVSVVVFGQVRRSDVRLPVEPQLIDDVVKSLRHNGVYLVD